MDILGGIKKFFQDLVNYLDFLYDRIVLFFLAILVWVIDSVKFLGRWLWETAVYLMDCFIKMFFGFINWFFDQLPDMDLPDGFDRGVTYLIEYGMILNKILPIKEGFIMLGILFGILLVVMYVRLMLYIYRILPFKFT